VKERDSPRIYSREVIHDLKCISHHIYSLQMHAPLNDLPQDNPRYHDFQTKSDVKS
jgi:hypothetical protein